MTLVIVAWLGVLALIATLVGAAAMSIERSGKKLFRKDRAPRGF
jgi:hypothetical protein